MAIEWDFVSGLVSAVFGLAGVWLGGYLTSRHEATRERVRVQKETTYLATLVVAHLDRFINGCVDVAFDDGTSEGLPAGTDNIHYQVTTELPIFEPLALDVDWKVLPPDLMYSVLSIPNRVQQLARRLSNPGFDDPPEHMQFFWERQHSFASLGLDVSHIVSQLRAHAGLPPEPPVPGGWDRDAALHEKQERIADERETHFRRVRELRSRATPPTPFGPTA